MIKFCPIRHVCPIAFTLHNVRHMRHVHNVHHVCPIIYLTRNP